MLLMGTASKASVLHTQLLAGDMLPGRAKGLGHLPRKGQVVEMLASAFQALSVCPSSHVNSRWGSCQQGSCCPAAEALPSRALQPGA